MDFTVKSLPWGPQKAFSYTLSYSSRRCIDQRGTNSFTLRFFIRNLSGSCLQSDHSYWPCRHLHEFYQFGFIKNINNNNTIFFSIIDFLKLLKIYRSSICTDFVRYKSRKHWLKCVKVKLILSFFTFRQTWDFTCFL